jgi:hypothetical protein
MPTPEKPIPGMSKGYFFQVFSFFRDFRLSNAEMHGPLVLGTPEVSNPDFLPKKAFQKFPLCGFNFRSTAIVTMSS